MTSTAHSFNIDIQVDTELDDRVVEEFRALIDEQQIVRAVTRTLQHERVEQASVSVVITDDQTVRQLNQQYRAVDAPTDVLSFASQNDDEADADGFVMPQDLDSQSASYLGDLVIALPYTLQQAQHYGTSPEAELRLLAVHGTLHLLGYDHDTQKAEQVMWASQSAILTELGDEGTIANLKRRTFDE